MGQHTSPDGTDPANSYGYPDTVPWSEIERFLMRIGVDPVDRGTLRTINFSHRGVRIERLRVREFPDGRRDVYPTDPSSDEPAMQITTARIEWDA